jgi:2-polyprenyl-6-hydroxyphenyl methylase/3-demethylubiquinone-9 3-methyltransferase
LKGLFKLFFYAGLVATGRKPSAYVGSYKSKRGMSFDNDIHDWMGGYPYESATVEEVSARMRTLGFEIVNCHPVKGGIRPFGTGCAEYTLKRTPTTDRPG